MKLRRSTAVLLALAWGLSGCVHHGSHPGPSTEKTNPGPSAVSDTQVNESALPVVVERSVGRKYPDQSSPVSENVRNYLRDALEESINTYSAFKVSQDALVTTEPSRLAHISASIISVRKNIIQFTIGPFAGVQKAFLDAEMEVRLVRPGQADLVISGKSHVSQSEDTVFVAPKQIKDWNPDDSWASVACTEALQAACRELARKIATEPRARELRASS